MKVRASVAAVSTLADRIGRRLWTLTPAARAARGRNEAARTRGLEKLAALSAGSGAPLFSRVLVDGQWDNANYWLRYALFRRALGLSAVQEVGLLGQYNRERVGASFAAFGIRSIFDFGQHVAERDSFLDAARRLLANTRTPADIDDWVLPEGVPPAIVYDGILKRQRRGDVDLADPNLPAMAAEALSAIHFAGRVLDREHPDLVVLSHMIDFAYGALAWAAVSRGIPVVILYGDFGTNRFVRIDRPEEIFSYPGRPERADEAELPPAILAALAEAGRRTLVDRIGGKTSDISAIYAFRRRSAPVDRAVLAERFGWDPQRPVIAVYAPNWFDYPNGSGRFPFRDFRDWADATLAVARETPQVNWLFKAHPCDEWYGKIRGPRFTDLVVSDAKPHVALCDPRWNGRSIIETVDGLVTVHGTAGIEAPALGTPVLLPYRGWYGAFGFAEFANDADDYKLRLTTRWWEKHDRVQITERANAFAGWYFSVPDWHEGWFLSDDSNQDAIWWDLDTVLDRHAGPIGREISEIRDWIQDGHRYFQIFKLLHATGFAPVRPRSIVEHSNEDPRRLQLSGGAPA